MPGRSFLKLKGPSYIRVYFGGLRPKGVQIQKNRDFGDIKLQIFRTEGAENFEKFKIFKEKLAIIWSFKGKFGQILII